jgi:hypothetical protein
MKPSEYEKIVKDSVTRRLELSRKKRADYAGDEDVLANFKRLAEAVRILRIPRLWDKNPALAYALFMDIMKTDRMINILIKEGNPENESMQDSWDDKKNYTDLAEALFVEAKTTKDNNEKFQKKATTGQRINNTIEETNKLFSALLALKNEELKADLEERKKRLKKYASKT